MSKLQDVLPWDSMTPAVLEELVFRLVGQMGAVLVEWRSPLGKVTASDGGRDVEATFHHESPDGDVQVEHWWLDAKHKSAGKSVPRQEVQDVAFNSSAYEHLAAMIIATNTSFTNSTKDWVREHNSKARGPKVKLWGREKLQSLVERYPHAVAKTFLEVLSREERQNFLASYFYEHGRVVTVHELVDEWQQLDGSESPAFLIAACYSEFSHGDIERRPWLVDVDGFPLVAVFTYSLTRLISAWSQNEGKLDVEVLTETSAYVMQEAAASLPSELFVKILDEPYTFIEGATNEENYVTPKSGLQYPIQVRALYRLLQWCASDCARFSMDADDVEGLAMEKRWRRFYRVAASERRMDHFSLAIVNRNVSCAVGLDTSDCDCPIVSSAFEKLDDGQNLREVISRVIEFRIQNPSGAHLAAVRTRGIPKSTDDLTVLGVGALFSHIQKIGDRSVE